LQSRPCWGNNWGHSHFDKKCAPKMKLNVRQVDTAKPKEKPIKWLMVAVCILRSRPKDQSTGV
jgi:hypothetical protein